MPILEVGSGSQRAIAEGSNVNSQALVFPGNVTAGNLLAAGGAVWDAGGSGYTIAVTDSLGTSYTVFLSSADNNFGGDFKKFIAIGIAPISGANTATVNPSTGSGSYIAFAADEFSGVDSSPLDVDGGESAGSSTSASDALTTLTANGLILGVCGYSGSDTTITPGGSYTQIGENEPNDTASYNFVFRIVTTPQAYTVDWTLGASNTWRVYTLAVREHVLVNLDHHVFITERRPRPRPFAPAQGGFLTHRKTRIA